MTSKIIRAGGSTLNGVKSVVYKEQVNADTDLRPGCVASASIEVEVYGEQDGAVRSGESLEYYQVGSDGNETLFGTFYAEPTIQTRGTYKFTAYDAVAKLDVDFSGRLAEIQDGFPMTLAALVSEACSVASVTVVGTFPMSDLEVQTFYADGITCRQILSWAAEIACRFVRCNPDGTVKFDWYRKVNEYRVTPGDGGTDDETYIYYKQDGLHYENYETAVLDMVAVHPTDDEQVAYIYPDSVISGNTMDITNNLLLTGADKTVYMSVAENIYDAVSDIPSYRPAQISIFPFNNPFRAGEIVKVTDIQGVSFVTPIMSMQVMDSSARLDSTGNKVRSDSANSVQETLINLADNLVRLKRLKVDWADIGTAVVSTLMANGINADWINAGSLTVLDEQSRIIFQADKDSKSVNLAGLTVTYNERADRQVLIGNAEFHTSANISVYDSVGDGASALTLFNDQGLLFFIGNDLDEGIDPVTLENAKFVGNLVALDDGSLELENLNGDLVLSTFTGDIILRKGAVEHNILQEISEITARSTANVTLSAAGTLNTGRIDRTAGIAVLTFSANLTASIPANTWTTIATVPSGYRPANQTQGVWRIDAAGHFTQVRVNPNGNIQLASDVATSAASLRGQLTWVVAGTTASTASTAAAAELMSFGDAGEEVI